MPGRDGDTKMMVFFKIIEKPEEEADLEAEVEDWSSIGVDRCWVGDEIAVAAVDDVDVQTD